MVRTNRDREELLEIIRNFRLIDDFFFAYCFDGFIEGIELILRIIMGIEDLAVIEVTTQQNVKNLYGHSVVFDVLAKDSAGNIYNIEIQKASAGALFRRARYNGVMIDSRELKNGATYDTLPERFVIFITETDVIGAGLPIYHIERTIRETGAEFSDGTHIIYVNAECRDETALGWLMHDFLCSDAKKMYYTVLADRVDSCKNNGKEEPRMCDAMEKLMLKREARGIRKGEARGIRKGEARGRLLGGEDIALAMLRGKEPVDSIVKYTSVSAERVAELARQHNIA